VSTAVAANPVRKLNSKVKFGVLGELTVTAGTPLHVGGPKQRTVLAMLIAHADHPVSVDSIIEAVWGEGAALNARRTVQTYVATLRGELGDVIVKSGSGWRLDVDRELIDACSFEDLYSSARDVVDTNPQRASVALREALAMWRGYPYADVEAHGFLDGEISRLSELRSAAQATRIEADLALGRDADLVGEIEALMAEHPYSERFRVQAMLALYRAGRQQEALRSYQHMRELLLEELGVDPTPELQELERRILDQDESLRLAPAQTIQRRAVLVADPGDPIEIGHMPAGERENLLVRTTQALRSAIDREGDGHTITAGTTTYLIFDSVLAAVNVAEAVTRRLDGEAMRFAIDWGDMVLENGRVSGPPVSRAAVMVAVAHRGQTLLSADAQLAVGSSGSGRGIRFENLGSYDLYGVEGSLLVYQLLVGDIPPVFPELETHRLPPPLPGGGDRMVPGYELREAIAPGSIGALYRAFQPSVGREVLIEVIGRGDSSDVDFIRNFEADAQRLSLLDHQNIAPLIDYWRQPDGAFLVYRYPRGGLLSQGATGDGERLVDQIGSSLGYAHSLGMIHGSVRPDRIALDEAGNASLLCFPVAGVAPEPSEEYRQYLAPEVAQGESATVASDIYSLAVLAREYGASDPALDRATDPDPSLRPSTVAQFLRELSPARAGSSSDRFTEARNPYKGLTAFHETDAADFFGRSAATEELCRALATSNLLAIVGPSGIGKSSVARAGLVPALRSGRLPGSERWLVTDMLPGSHPFLELQRALARVSVALPVGLTEALAAQEPLALEHVAGVLPDRADLVVLVDQFEELFTMTGAAERQAFLDLVETSVEERWVRFVLTLRADFFDRPLLYAGFGKLLKTSTVMLTSPTPGELAEAIKGPAQGVGVEVAPELVERMVGEVRDQPGALPLLQHTLAELFASRRSDLIGIADFEERGGVSGSLAKRAESINSRLPDSTKVKQLFLRLVAIVDESAPTRRRVRVTELADLEVEEAIEAFARSRLLVLDSDPGTRIPTIEVSHEALLSHWPRLAGWIDSAREDLTMVRRLEESRREWEGSGRDDAYLLTRGRLAQHQAWTATTTLALSEPERDYLTASRRHDERLKKRSRRRRNFIMGGFAAAAVLAAVLAIVAFIQRGEAERSTALAEARQVILEADKAVTTDPELSMLLSLEAIKAFRAAGAEPPPSAIGALRQGLNESVVDRRIPGGVSVAVSPDGAYLATLSEDENVAVWSLTSWEVVRELEPPGGRVQAVGFDASGDLLLVSYGGVPRPLRVWEWRTGSHVDLGGETPLPVGQLAFANRRVMGIDQQRGLVTIRRGPPDSGLDGFEVWDFNRHELLYVVGSDEPDAPAPSFFAERRLALLELPNETRAGWAIRIMDSITGEPLDSVAVDWGEHIPFLPLTFSVSPEGSRAVIHDLDQVALIDLDSGEVRWVNDRLTQPLDPLWLPDGEQLFVGGPTAPSVLDASDGVVVRQLPGGVRGGVISYAPIPGTDLVAAAGDDVREVVIFDWTKVLSGYTTLSSDFPQVTDMSFVGDGDLLAVSDWNSNALIDAKSGEIVAHRAGRDPMEREQTGYPIFSDGGRYTAGPDAEGRSILWSNQDQAVAYMSPPGWQIRGVSEDGSLAVIVSEADGYSTRLIHTGDGNLIADLDIGGNFMPQAIFSPDGTLVLTNNIQFKRIWDTSTGSLLREIELFGWDQRFTPDGNTLVVGGREGTIYVFDVEGLLAGLPTEETVIREIPAHNNFITMIRVSPDGSVFLSRAHDEPLKSWDMETGEKLGEFGTTDELVGAVHPTEPLLYVPLPGGEIGVYTLDTDDLMEVTEARLTRDFSEEECQLYLRRSCGDDT
jgi:DNA-binding SARP family transcriptional activator/WD40 repeat protein/serine/threonine protein kinase